MKALLRLILPALACAAAAFLLPLLLIPSLGSLLHLLGVEDFAAIFDQLRSASVCPPAALILAVCIVLALLLRKRLWPWLLLCPATLLLSLYMTQVNGIRFGTVLVSLVRMALSGAL